MLSGTATTKRPVSRTSVKDQSNSSIHDEDGCHRCDEENASVEQHQELTREVWLVERDSTPG